MFPSTLSVRPTDAEIQFARIRAFGATGYRTAPTSVDYTQFTDAELRQARDDVLSTLEGENATDEDATRADQIGTEIERRNAVTAATNERRQRLAQLQVTERWSGGGNGQRSANEPERRGQRPPEDEPGDELAVPRDWRAQLAHGAADCRLLRSSHHVVKPRTISGISPRKNTEEHGYPSVIR